MKNVLVVRNENNEELTIELLFNFKIEDIGKEYIVYTVNDDGVSNNVGVIISEIIYNEGIPQIVPIDESEKEMVLLFYANVRNSN